MQIFTSYKDILQDYKGCVVVIGNFDGVHCGHQALLKRAKEIARDTGVQACVLTFEPHPHVLFQPDRPPARITPYDLKVSRLAHEGMDGVFSVPFDWDFASQSAEDFVRNVLVDGLGVSHVVVGYDFCFGQLRKGTPDTIRTAGIEVTIVEKVEDAGQQSFSSSRMRQLIRHGDIAGANAILGWDWEISGKVVKGDQRGRELGYPTANFALGDTIHPAYGVYATLARVGDAGAWLPSATNIGIRPMFEVETAQVETFIFDFDQEIYGEVLHVRPVEHLRGEAKFDTLDALVEQIEKDCVQARKILQGKV